MGRADTWARSTCARALLWVVGPLVVVVAVLGMHGVDSRMAVRWHPIASVSTTSHHAAVHAVVHQQRPARHATVRDRGRCCLVPFAMNAGVEPAPAGTARPVPADLPSTTDLGRDGPPP